jgi:hypothetical protein
MATLILLNGQREASSVETCRIRVHKRVLTRFRAWQLDIVLASGGDPDSSAALSLRAHALISLTTRKELSRAIQRILRDAVRPHHPFDPAVPICRHKVLDAQADLEELADKLRRSGPVDARGVAQARLLLRDGSSPVYNDPRADDLRPPLQAAIDALEVCL